MKKFTKTLLTLGLLVGGLAGCGEKTSEVPSSEVPSSTEPIVEKFTVEFWLTDVNFISEQEVVKGEKVAKPADPVRLGYTFDYWGVKKVVDGEVVVEEYDFTLPVNADLEIYAQWEIPYSADPNRYTLIGALANSDYTKESGAEWNTAFMGLEMKKTDPEAEVNEFLITVDLGYNALIKVKSLVDRYDDNYNWGDGAFIVDNPEYYGAKSADGKGDFAIKSAGNYTVKLVTVVVNGVSMGAQAKIYITRNGDPLEPEKVTPTPEAGASVEWRLSGDTGIPGHPVWSEKEGPIFNGDSTTHVYTFGPVYLKAGVEFKLTKDGSWDGEAGYGSFPKGVFGAAAVYKDGDDLPEGAAVGDGKPGSNNVVLVSGLYIFTVAAVDKDVPREELVWTFSATHGLVQLAGSMNGWGELDNPKVNVLVPDSAEAVVGADEAGLVTHTFTFKAEITVAEGDEWKIRTYGAWIDGAGDAENENLKLAAGTYEFEAKLVVTFGQAAYAYKVSFTSGPTLKTA